jgi:tRNA(fMet)-specific endonuclease VapC
MTHLLDTDHLSILQHPTSREFQTVLGHVNRHPAGDVALSVVNVHEQVLGANARIGKAKSPAEVVRGYSIISRMLQVMAPFPVLPFSAIAAGLFPQLRSQKVRIGTMDLRIACIALAHDLVVVTRNAGDFGLVPGLRTEDWTT